MSKVDQLKEQIPEPTATQEGMKEARVSLDEAVVQFKEAAKSARAAARTAGLAVSSDAGDYYQEGREKVSELSDKTLVAAKERPLLVAGVSFAAGLVVSRLLKGK